MENSHAEQENSHGWRVKLYELESTGNWIDLGVGHVQVQNVTELGGPALCIASEAERGKYILVSKIQSEDLYEKQGGTSSRLLRLGRPPRLTAVACCRAK